MKNHEIPKNLDHHNSLKLARIVNLIEEKTINKYVYELLSDNNEGYWENEKKIDLRIIEEGITISKKSGNF